MEDRRTEVGKRREGRRRRGQRGGRGRREPSGGFIQSDRFLGEPYNYATAVLPHPPDLVKGVDRGRGHPRGKRNPETHNHHPYCRPGKNLFLSVPRRTTSQPLPRYGGPGPFPPRPLCESVRHWIPYVQWGDSETKRETFSLPDRWDWRISTTLPHHPSRTERNGGD